MDETTLTTSARKGSATRGAGRQYRRAARQCEQVSLAELFRYWQATREGRRAIDLSRRAASAGEPRTSRRRLEALLHRQHTGHR